MIAKKINWKERCINSERLLKYALECWGRQVKAMLDYDKKIHKLGVKFK